MQAELAIQNSTELVVPKVFLGLPDENVAKIKNRESDYNNPDASG
jgi:hypothetical protein